MTRINLVVSMCVVTLFCGCSAKKAQRVGFLSDYSRLEPQSKVSSRYLAMDRLKGYSKLIIDPVKIHLHEGSKSEKKVTAEVATDMKSYMHAALVKSVEGAYQVVYQPGPGVARVRVALTDLKKSKVAMNVIPTTKLVGSGLGGASLEAELVDSQTGEQIGAVIESQLGNRLSLDGLSAWGDAKSVMDDWAKRFRERLDEAHGVQPR